MQPFSVFYIFSYNSMVCDTVSVADTSVCCFLLSLLATLLSPITDVSLILPVDFWHCQCYFYFPSSQQKQNEKTIPTQKYTIYHALSKNSCITFHYVMKINTKIILLCVTSHLIMWCLMTLSVSGQFMIGSDVWCGKEYNNI